MSDADIVESLGDWKRTHDCGALGEDHLGDEVVLMGWVTTRRDHGGVIFVDLRDGGERVQVVFRPDASPEAHARAGELRSEYVILVKGVVMRRSADTVNPKLATGEVEDYRATIPGAVNAGPAGIGGSSGGGNCGGRSDRRARIQC